jgi:hypothetical protein
MDDNTDQIQELINKLPGGGTLNIPAGRHYIDAVRGLKLKSVMTLKLESKAELAAIPNDKTNSAVLRVYDCRNVEILGPGMIIGERDLHIGTSGEWGNGIELKSASNVLIGGDLTITRCWGDGIILSDGTNKNIELNKVDLVGNRRQGLSVIDVDGLKVTYCSFLNTGGTAPGDGIDIEPDNDSEFAHNIFIDWNLFKGNAGSNIGIGGPHGQFKNIYVGPHNVYDRHTQPIWVSGKSGKLGEPFWATALSAFKGQPWYRWWGYPNEWHSTT